MKLEDQVCSLEYAKRLKELGVKQNSFFSWLEGMVEWKIYPNSPCFPDIGWRDSKKINNHHDEYSAFTVAELGEMLPAYANIDGDHNKLQLSKYFRPGSGLYTYSCEYWNLTDGTHYRLKKGFYDVNEANARAVMLIYLLELIGLPR